jgi:glutamine cyclotransferase
LRIDPDTNRVVTSVHGDFDGTDAVAGEGALWVVGRDGVTKRDETTGAVETVIQVDDPLSIRDAFGALWVSTHAGAKTTIVKIDPAIDEVVATADVSPDSQYVVDHLALEAGEGAVWALDDRGNLMKIEPLSGKAVARFDVGAGAGLAVGGGAVWVTDNLHDQLSKIDPETGEVTITTDLAFAPDVIAYLGDTLWAIDNGAATVTPIDPSTLQPGRSIGVATDPVAISGGLGSVWVVGVDAVTRIDIVTDVAVVIPVGMASSTVAVDPRTRAVWLIKRPPGPGYG